MILIIKDSFNGGEGGKNIQINTTLFLHDIDSILFLHPIFFYTAVEPSLVVEQCKSYNVLYYI